MRRPVLLLSLLAFACTNPFLVAQEKRAVADLIEDLRKNDAEKLKAIEQLDALGEKAADAAPALVQILTYKNEDVRLAATMALGKIGNAGVDPLTKYLDAQYATPKNLGKIDSLLKKLGSTNFNERDAARKDLEAMSYHALAALRKAAKASDDLETSRRADEIVKTVEAMSATRFYAVWSLAFIGAPAKSSTATVVKALSDPTSDVRRKAAYALGRIDADPNLVVDTLVNALADSDKDVRQTAAESLPKMSKVAVPVLIKSLQGDDAELKGMAIKILGDIGVDAASAIPELRALLLANKSEAFVIPLTDSLARIGPASLKTLTEGAGHENGSVRHQSLNALQRVGAAAVPTIIDLLGSKYVEVQRQSATILGGMQVHDKSVVIGLGFATKDKDFAVRFNALNSLQRMGSSAKLAEPYVVVLLTDLDPQIRLTAFNTLRTIGVDPQPGLKKALSNPDPTTRITTASLMVQLNFEVALAEPILLEGLDSKDEALKTQAAYALALRGLQGEVVLPIFVNSLKHKAASVRRQSAEMIAKYGAKASTAAPSLIHALDDEDDSVCNAALNTLRSIGADPKVLFPAMVKVLRRPDPKLHGIASQVIFQVGPDALPQLIEMLKKDDAPGVRLACLQTLAMVGPPAKDAVGELIKTLDDPTARVRMTAARALGNIGPDAKSAEAALMKATKDTDAHVQSIANAALAQIRAEPNAKNFEVKGVLTPGDPFDKVRQAHFHVVHTFHMKKGQTYTIDLISQWDNYLRLENPQGVQIAADDDGGGFPNARITIAAQTDGWHRIIVTSFGQGGNGPYTLRVK